MTSLLTLVTVMAACGNCARSAETGLSNATATSTTSADSEASSESGIGSAGVTEPSDINDTTLSLFVHNTRPSELPPSHPSTVPYTYSAVTVWENSANSTPYTSPNKNHASTDLSPHPETAQNFPADSHATHPPHEGSSDTTKPLETETHTTEATQTGSYTPKPTLAEPGLTEPAQSEANPPADSDTTSDTTQTSSIYTLPPNSGDLVTTELTPQAMTTGMSTGFPSTEEPVQRVPVQEMQACFEGKRRIYFQTSHRLELAFRATPLASGKRFTRYCTLQVTVPSDMVVKVTMNEVYAEDDCDDLLLNLHTPDSYMTLMLATACVVNGASREPILYSPVNDLNLEFRSPMRYPFDLNITMDAVPFSDKPHLEIVYESPNKGYIYTPGLARGPYPPLMDDVLELKAPADHAAMISVQYFDLPEKGFSFCLDRLMMYVGNRSFTNLQWIFCDEPHPPPFIHTDVLIFRFISGEQSYVPDEIYKGFRLLFTFHNDSAMPETTPEGQWNCTVPYWPDFQQHFLCNLVSDCVNSEDEQLCPYTDARCGQGQVRAGNKCYWYFKPPGIVSWDRASVMCLRRQAVLASPNTRAQWVSLGRLLRYDKTFQRVYIGLRSTSTSVPFL